MNNEIQQKSQSSLIEKVVVIAACAIYTLIFILPPAFLLTRLITVGFVPDLCPSWLATLCGVVLGFTTALVALIVGKPIEVAIPLLLLIVLELVYLPVMSQGAQHRRQMRQNRATSQLPR